MEESLKCFVEPPHTAETRRQSHICHRHLRLVDQLLGKENPSRLRHRDWRSSKMLQKQAPKLPLSHSQASRQPLDTCGIAIKRALRNQRQCSRNRVRRAAPRGHIRSRLGTAAQAGPEPSVLCRRRRSEKAAVLELCRPRRADRSAIDPGRCNANVDQPVKTGISALQGAIANIFVRRIHASIVSLGSSLISGFRTWSLHQDVTDELHLAAIAETARVLCAEILCWSYR